jgi:hypothetical protein
MLSYRLKQRHTPVALQEHIMMNCQIVTVEVVWNALCVEELLVCEVEPKSWDFDVKLTSNGA